jgi:hypothetical protein
MYLWLSVCFRKHGYSASATANFMGGITSRGCESNRTQTLAPKSIQASLPVGRLAESLNAGFGLLCFQRQPMAAQRLNQAKGRCSRNARIF